jgi:hypothetical protein
MISERQPALIVPVVADQHRHHMVAVPQHPVVAPLPVRDGAVLLTHRTMPGHRECGCCKSAHGVCS